MVLRFRNIFIPEKFRILHILILFSLPVYSADIQADASIAISNVAAEPGSTVEVSIVANGFGNIVSFNSQIEFNPNVLSYINITNHHPAFQGMAVNLIGDSLLSFGWFLFSPVNIPNGTTLFNIHFHFCSDFLSCAENETFSFVNGVEGTTYIMNPSYVQYPVSFYNGSVYSLNPLRILTIEVEGQGNILVDDEPYTEPLIAAENSEMQIEAIPDDGWQFDSWTGDLAGTQNPKTFTLMGDMNVTAVFSEDSNGDDDDEVPDYLTLQGIQIEDGESECYDAVHTITVGGNPEDHYFIVKNGGEAWLIAGESIVLLPGTKVEQGGYLHASITTDESFCLRTNDTYHEKDDLITQYNQLPVNENNLLFRLYPNPASSYINIEFNNHIHELVENPVVEIYDIMGKKIRHVAVPGAGTYSIDVSGMQSGMYILRAIYGTQTAYERVIIR